MKYVPRVPIPWDMVVFLTITVAGFGYSVHRLAKDNSWDPQKSSVGSAFELGAGTGFGTTANLGCLEQSLATQRVENGGPNVRLRGRFCNPSGQQKALAESVAVRNLSNGHEGRVFFHAEDTSFVTGPVSLRTGMNEIEVVWNEGQGVRHSIRAQILRE